MRAIQITETGGPEVLQYREVPTPEPGAGQVRVRVEYVGVNFVDVYHRIGLYKLPLPLIPGREGAGTINAIGDGVSGWQIGDRVGFAFSPNAYAEQVIVPASALLRIPNGVATDLATAAMLQGLTAHYLALSTYPLDSTKTTLIHAAAGGAGQLLVQVAKLRGARIIGTVSTEEKAQLARDLGADEVILYSQTDFEPEVKKLTNGKGVDVVYDSVGKDTFERSLNSLKVRGTMVLWGQASGAVPPIDPNILQHKGSLYLTRPTLGAYIADRAELDWRANDVFGWLQEGKLRVRIDRTFKLQDAAEAHRYIESRAGMGKVLLVP